MRLMFTFLFPFVPLKAWNPDWTSRVKGFWGEEAVARALWQGSYRLLHHRWTAPDRSDIDLVAADRERLYFCEVKLREPDSEAWKEIFDRDRQVKLRRTVGHYLRATRQQTVDIQYDAYIVRPSLENPRSPIIEVERAYLNPHGTPSWRTMGSDED